MDGVHIDVIAAPLKRLAIGDKFQTSLIGNGAGGSVLAGNPFRIKQGERPGLHRDRQARMKQAAGRFAGVDRDGDLAGKTWCRSVLREESGCKKDGKTERAKGKRSHLVVGVLTSFQPY